MLCRLTTIYSLSISSCPELRSLDGLELLPSLNFLHILSCPKLAEAGQLNFDATMQGKSMSFSYLSIDDTSLLKLSFLRNFLSSHAVLTIHRSSEPTMFVGEDEEWLQILASVERLSFDRCPTMKSFPTWLHGLTSLQYLSIKKCLEINSLPEKGLPPSLRELSFHECHPMLKEQLEKLKAENSRIYIVGI
ncbi:uncharacterized protein LOC109707698 [Ananas comosus]|uniref:Uncharacterized protein LOC109707698 n=1 Tax=Ananas comosus TaxID=4615 RepID=A0A6P5EMQ2_ANACO|nr:uncharacterized protein LOC109707698 [Ananas comosus]